MRGNLSSLRNSGWGSAGFTRGQVRFIRLLTLGRRCEATCAGKLSCRSAAKLTGAAARGWTNRKAPKVGDAGGKSIYSIEVSYGPHRVAKSETILVSRGCARWSENRVLLLRRMRFNGGTAR